MKGTFILVCMAVSLVFTHGTLHGNTFKETYLKLIGNRDFDKLAIHLREWEKTNSADPELFIAFFNYHIYRNSETVTVYGSDPDSPEAPQEKISFKKDDVMTGIHYLDEGLKLYPARLDMHMGIISMLGEIEDYEKQKNHIIIMIRLVPVYHDSWLWSDGAVVDDFDEKFQNEIQNRITVYMSLNDILPFQYARDISLEMIKLYPRTIWWYNNIASFHMHDNDMTAALKYFKMGEAIDPKDEIIIYNIAYCFEMMKELPQAVIYYEKLLDSPNPDVKKEAMVKIESLKNKIKQ